MTCTVQQILWWKGSQFTLIFLNGKTGQNIGCWKSEKKPAQCCTGAEQHKRKRRNDLDSAADQQRECHTNRMRENNIAWLGKKKQILLYSVLGRFLTVPSLSVLILWAPKSILVTSILHSKCMEAILVLLLNRRLKDIACAGVLKRHIVLWSWNMDLWIWRKGHFS